MNNLNIDENTDKINKKILDSILEDDDEQFSQLVSQINAIDSNTNQKFHLNNYKLPFILAFSPSIASLCAFFSAKKCFESLTLLIPEGLNSEYFQKNDDCNRSLIHFACAGGNLDIVRELEQSGFDLSIKDNMGKTPSHYSAIFGRTEIIKYLWTKGVDILQLKSKLLPIHEACEYGNLEIIKFICENIDDKVLLMRYIKYNGNRGNSLHLACQGGHNDVVKYILSNKLALKLINESDNESRTPLICACENGSLECVKALVQFGNVQFNNSHRKKLPLIEAAANGHSDVVQYLLKQKACDINAKNSSKLTAIEAAIINGRSDVVEILIKNGAIENFNETEIGNLFLDACGTFNIDVVKFLDKILNVPYKKMGEIFMKQACKIENKELIEFLLDKKCEFTNEAISSINFRAKWTPFMTYLKSKGADFSNVTLSSGYPLIVNSIYECASLNTVQQLISEGVVLTAQMITKYDLLNIVASMGRVELFNFLSTFKTELTHGDVSFYALESRIYDNMAYKSSKYYNGCLEIAEALLRDYNIDKNDTEIISYAFTHSLLDVLELLAKYNSNFANIRIYCDKWYYDYDPNLFSENLQFLKDKNFDINRILSRDSYPLVVEAIKSGKSEVIQDLISKGFEFNSEIISKFDLMNEASHHQNFELFKFLLSFKPEIKKIKSCVLCMFCQYVDCVNHKEDKKKKECFEIIETLFTEYNIDPNNELFINFAIHCKAIDIIELLAKLNADFNCCYIDYSSLVTHRYLVVFSHLEKHGCLFQKAKYCHENIPILPYTRVDDDNFELFKDENEISPIQLNIDSIVNINYDINTLLFLLKYASNDDIIKLSYSDKNIIDILLEYKCYNEIIYVFTKLGKVILPNKCGVDEFKELISTNVNIQDQNSEAKILINSLING